MLLVHYLVLICWLLFRVSRQHSSLSQQVCAHNKFAQISNKQNIDAGKKGMSFVAIDLWQEISFNFKGLKLLAITSKAFKTVSYMSNLKSLFKVCLELT